MLPAAVYCCLTTVSGVDIVLCQGQVLLSLQIVRKGHAHAQLPPPPPITPMLKEAFIEVICVGVRHLKPYMMVSAQKPEVRGETTTCARCIGLRVIA